MTSIESALIESYERNSAILQSLCEVITPDQLAFKVAENEMDLGEHLCHIHGTRRWWIAQIEPERLEGTERLYTQDGEDWHPIRDLDLIKSRLPESGNLVLQLYKDKSALVDGPLGPYSHPVMFLQHMFWHEGWHVGSCLAILRVNGAEPREEWEDASIWGRWREPEMG